MGEIKQPAPVLLVLAASSRHAEALEWARGRAVEAWGPIALESPLRQFDETDYYRATMGEGLVKVLLAFQPLIDPAVLPSIKHQTNAWEAACCAAAEWPEPRPLNLDPGYLTAAKLVLATTKDRDHRIYVGDGIFAEVTLLHRRGLGWQPRDWTYPDYRAAECLEFFERCRGYLREHRHAN